MKKLAVILFVLLAHNAVLAQKEKIIIGQMYYYWNDSVEINEPRMYSRIKLDKNNEVIYRSTIDIFDLYCWKFDLFRGGKRISGKVCGTDTTEKTTSFSTDEKEYVISGTDTTLIFQYGGAGDTLKKTCIKGGNYTDYYYFDKKSLLTKDVRVYTDSSARLINIYRYDKKKRPVYYGFDLHSESDSLYHYRKIKYDDNARTREEYDGFANPLTYQKLFYHMNKEGLPLSMDAEYVEDGKRVYLFKVRYSGHDK